MGVLRDKVLPMQMTSGKAMDAPGLLDLMWR
jgi:hypothetical protein